MTVGQTVSEIRRIVQQMRRNGATIGLVPTMGFLHAGHLSLVRDCRRLADRTVVSIFVNPTQFGPAEDFAVYPRDLEGDLSLCSEEGVDAVFAPLSTDLYPADFSTWVEEERLTTGLCGRSRPGHFRGVTTVVAKLFNIIQPDVAVFGQKDAQQALVIRRMVRDLDFPVRIHVSPIVRESDGLAMSSRNARLSAGERERALSLSRGLKKAEQLFAGGVVSAAELREAVVATLTAASVEVDYVDIVDPDSLEAVDSVAAGALVAVAARVGQTRLIDNCVLPARR